MQYSHVIHISVLKYPSPSLRNLDVSDLYSSIIEKELKFIEEKPFLKYALAVTEKASKWAQMNDRRNPLNNSLLFTPHVWKNR